MTFTVAVLAVTFAFGCCVATERAVLVLVLVVSAAGAVVEWAASALDSDVSTVLVVELTVSIPAAESPFTAALVADWLTWELVTALEVLLVGSTDGAVSA